MAKVVDERTEKPSLAAKVGDMLILDNNDYRIIGKHNKLYFLLELDAFCSTTEGYGNIDDLLREVGAYYIKEIIPREKIKIRIVD